MTDLSDLAKGLSEVPWIEWSGGDMPVRADLTVEVIRRSAECLLIDKPEMAWHHQWKHSDHGRDIIAYRVAGVGLALQSYLRSKKQ